MEMALMTLLAFLNDLMLVMCQQISNSHLTDFLGLAAYFI